MLPLTEGQRKHISNVIMTKRKEDYNYPGGNAALAKRLGVSPQLLSMWINNKRTPSGKQLLVLSEVFNMSLRGLCNLKPRSKNMLRRVSEGGKFTISPEGARRSMKKICNIANVLIERELQMLRGKIGYKEHRDWQNRIQEYVEIL